MPDSVQDSIYQAIAQIRLIDPHTHINPYTPASRTLADLLGYHYYTELAHSSGMPKCDIEEPGIDPRELVRRLVNHLGPIDNTAQYRWLVEICRKFFDLQDDRLDTSNWEAVYDTAAEKMASADWADHVLNQSNVEAVFLTNDFDDSLSGFDTSTYIPCLRTDDLVFHLSKSETQSRLASCTGIELNGSLVSLRDSLQQRFEHFVDHGARACAISLPPNFAPRMVSDGRAGSALDDVLRNGSQANPSNLQTLSHRVFWTLAELCDEYSLPFDLMIGVNRGVYAKGVYQGQDLYDSRVSLIQYRELFNAFPSVRFPISVLASVTNQELVSYAWIFPNVITNGHWWYSNTPSFIARDAAARLEAVPRTKQIAYYSDAYKLEFVWPKFDMYRQILAGILADHFVRACGWTEERAIELGKQVLRDNVDEIFPAPLTQQKTVADPNSETWVDDASTRQSDLNVPGAASATSATLTGEAIGIVEIDPESSSDALSSRSSSPAQETTILDTNDDLRDSLAPLSDDTIPIDTVVDEQIPGGNSPSVAPGLTYDVSDDDLPDLPTKIDVSDTVRIDDVDDEFTEQAENDASSVARDPLDLDPLPSTDEIHAVGIQDVELHDRSAVAKDGMPGELDPEPLDVGDLLSDSDTNREATIRPLRGDQSFLPDEELLRAHPDPVTGELVLPVPEDGSPIDSDDISNGDPNATLEPDLALDLDQDAIDLDFDQSNLQLDDTAESDQPNPPRDREHPDS